MPRKALEFAVNNHDLAIIRGFYGYKPALPAIPGSEALGVVEALGAGVQGFSAGQKDAVPPGPPMWAEYFTAPAKAAVPVPPTIPYHIPCHLPPPPLHTHPLFQTSH